MTSDPLLPLIDLPGVAEAADEARAAVDELLWNRSARRKSTNLASESAVVGAWCNASFEGAEILLDSLRSGAVEDSPMGRIAMRTLAMYSELPAAAELIGTAPLQALARMHAVAAVGQVPEEELGRPRTNEDVTDSLRLGPVVPAEQLSPRLQGLAQLLLESKQVPAIILAGIVHGELAVLRPFSAGSGTVARASTRLVLRARGVDPDSWAFPEAGLRTLGRNKYRNALASFATGEPEGVAEWLITHSQTIAVGARAAVEELDHLPDDS